MRFIVTGMFRSGTTYLTRLLDSNPAIACASDPIFPLFKTIRNCVEDKPFGCEAPLGNYSGNEEQAYFLSSLAEFDLGYNLNSKSLSLLKEKIRKHSRDFSPKFSTNCLSTLNANTFQGLLEEAFLLIQREYGGGTALAVGFKEVWIDEFVSKMLKNNVCDKVIHVIRDPRAVAASNYVSGSRYPNLFLARYWRLSAQQALNNIHNFPDSYFIIKYEDLIFNTQNTVKNICEFLEVPFTSEIIKAKTLMDDSGMVWSQNSSYSATEMVDASRWVSSIPIGHLRVMETLCSKEMDLFDYKKTQKDVNLQVSDMDNLTSNEIATWIKPYCNYDYVREIQIELADLISSK